MPTDLPADLPRPFYDQWSRTRRPAAHALWDWHSAFAHLRSGARPGSNGVPATVFDAEAERAERGEPLQLVREEVWTDAYAACENFDLDRELLAAQVDAARVFSGNVRFSTSDELKRFVGRWAIPHGRLLAGLSGVDMSVQLRYADELTRGFFYLGRLLSLPRDVEKGDLFIPTENLEQKGVPIEQLANGRVDESVRGLLWKESVRIRDALAQGRPLVAALSLRHRFALKRFWIGALELLNELERRDFDLWSRPLDLSLFRRIQVYVQTVLGRSVSR